MKKTMAVKQQCRKRNLVLFVFVGCEHLNFDDQQQLKILRSQVSVVSSVTDEHVSAQ